MCYRTTAFLLSPQIKCRAPCSRNEGYSELLCGCAATACPYCSCCTSCSPGLFCLLCCSLPMVQLNSSPTVVLLQLEEEEKQKEDLGFLLQNENTLRETKKAVASKTQTGRQMSYQEVSRLPSTLTSPPQNYFAQRNTNTCQKPSPVYHIGYLQDQVKLKELWQLLGTHSLTTSLWHL